MLCNPVDKLAALCKAETINDYMECFLTHVECEGPFDKLEKKKLQKSTSTR